MSSPAEAAQGGAACCQLEAAGCRLSSPQEKINPKLHSCLHWENDMLSATFNRLPRAFQRDNKDISWGKLVIATINAFFTNSTTR